MPAQSAIILVFMKVAGTASAASLTGTNDATATTYYCVLLMPTRCSLVFLLTLQIIRWQILSLTY